MSPAIGPHDSKPRRGWAADRTPWWCDACRTLWHGLYPWMNGGCPQPRPEGRCGTILLDPRTPEGEPS